MSLLRIRDFRLLFAGEGISLIGDQFYFIALPWLVLQLTSDAAVLGIVVALQGIPRAAFMLVGGAVTDRFSPRKVMMGSNLARLGLVTLLAALVGCTTAAARAPAARAVRDKDGPLPGPTQWLCDDRRCLGRPVALARKLGTMR